MCLASIFAANSIGLLPISVFAKCVSGPHVFCNKFIYNLYVCTTRARRESMARVVSLSSAVVCIESIPAYAGVVVCGYLFLVYVWLSCRAVSAVVCIESIPAYAGVIVCGCHFWCMSGSLAGQLFSQISLRMRGIIARY